MATNTYTEILNRNTQFFDKVIHKWFVNNGFELISFEGNNFETSKLGIYNNIKENAGYSTYFKGDVGGSLLVFEIKISDLKFECICYTPISLFGFFDIKVSFKEKAPWITKYRQHGYEHLTALKDFLNEKRPISINDDQNI